MKLMTLFIILCVFTCGMLTVESANAKTSDSENEHQELTSFENIPGIISLEEFEKRQKEEKQHEEQIILEPGELEQDEEIIEKPDELDDAVWEVNSALSSTDLDRLIKHTHEDRKEAIWTELAGRESDMRILSDWFNKRKLISLDEETAEFSAIIDGTELFVTFKKTSEGWQLWNL